MGDQSNTKDPWDKLSRLTPVFATTLMGLLGLYFTNTYEDANNKRNLALDRQAAVEAERATKLRELEAVEKLLPHLTSSEGNREGQKLALIAIRELGSARIAIQFAEILGTAGARDALEFTARTAESTEDSLSAEAALQRLDELAQGIITEGAPLSSWQEVVERIRAPDPDDEAFQILHHPSGNGDLIQIAIGPDAGSDLYVAYSENGTDFFCHMSREDAVEAFTRYAQGSEGWKPLCDWTPM